MRGTLSHIKIRLNDAGARLSEENLIRFEWRMIVFTAALMLLLVGFVSLRLSESSIGMWDKVVPPAANQSTGVVVGTPRAIRSDEWLRSTPFTLSQYEQGYPVRNESIGVGEDPLIMSLPVYHYTTLFKPQNWGYFSLGLDRGFSFFWAFKIFGLILSSFFLLLLLTKSSFRLAVTGSMWLFFSGFVQWWFSTLLVEMLISMNLMFIALAYIFLSKKKLAVGLGALVFVIFALDFALLLYPPFQIPLAYLTVFLLFGFFLEKNRRRTFARNFKHRLPVLAGIGVVIMAVLALFYRDAKPTIDVISATVYPGRRISLGGEIDLTRIFSGFTDVPITETRFPAIWGNACEASNFILLFPAILLATGRNAVLRIRNNPLIVALSAYLVLLFIYTFHTIPEPLARLTLLSFVPSNRALLGLGAGSIILTIIFLSEKEERSTTRFAVAGSVLALLALLFYGHGLEAAASDFFHLRFVLVIAATFSVMTFLLLRKQVALFSAAILLVLIPFYNVNPVSVGLDPILGKDVEQAALQMKQEKPQSRWVVYGDNLMANFLMSSGLTIENGTKYTPILDFMHKLDPEHKYEDIYNRMANITFVRPGESETDAVKVWLIAPDSYAVQIDPCSDRLKNAGIDSFAFFKTPADDLSCLVRIREFPDNGVSFYQRRP